MTSVRQKEAIWNEDTPATLSTMPPTDNTMTMRFSDARSSDARSRSLVLDQSRTLRSGSKSLSIQRRVEIQHRAQLKISPFLSLPPELRIMVYVYVFNFHGNTKYLSNSAAANIVYLPGLKRAKLNVSTPSVLLICRHITIGALAELRRTPLLINQFFKVGSLTNIITMNVLRRLTHITIDIEELWILHDPRAMSRTQSGLFNTSMARNSLFNLTTMPTTIYCCAMIIAASVKRSIKCLWSWKMCEA
ncbi:hypothetical protein K432DRAFT_403889 [Lepidopterella palustris CBS 459.81]|uniref:Uncharacterized protein n=1 Tax=Lepidopterella palustris CBS 459.81 TaxID=1314670 RepID=A0A8E2JG53_9PEZI|nr:hypothetical protein K432DRAFT_403889 [Lepidopterella palustris CBS 459.81]